MRSTWLTRLLENGGCSVKYRTMRDILFYCALILHNAGYDVEKVDFYDDSK